MFKACGTHIMRTLNLRPQHDGCRVGYIPYATCCHRELIVFISPAVKLTWYSRRVPKWSLIASKQASHRPEIFLDTRQSSYVESSGKCGSPLPQCKVRLCVRLIYLLTPWCRVLLEKLTGFQLVKKFPAFYGTRRFITAVTSARHLSLSWASSIQSVPPHSTSWRSILILSSLRHK